MCFSLKYTRAEITLECLDVTDAVNCSHVKVQVVLSRELPAAMVAFKPGVGMFWSAGVLSMRRVVVSVDRRLVVEHHRTKLTLDLRLQILKHRCTFTLGQKKRNRFLCNDMKRMVACTKGVKSLETSSSAVVALRVRQKTGNRRGTIISIENAYVV